MFFLQKMVKAEKTYFSPMETIFDMADLIQCGLMLPANHAGDAGVAANNIRQRRSEFKRLLPLAIASVRPNQRVEEVSARAGDAPAGITGVAAAAGDDDLALVQLQREHMALVARKTESEVKATEALALERAESARALAASRALSEYQIQERQEQKPLVHARLEAEAKKAQLEAQRAEQQLRLDAEAAAREQQRKDADAAHKRKRAEDDAAAEAYRHRERILVLESVLRAADALDDAANEHSELATLYLRVKDSQSMAKARERATRVWRKAHARKRSKPTAGPAPIPACGVSVYDDSYAWDDDADQGVYIMAETAAPDSREYVGFSHDPTRRTRDHAAGVGGVEAAKGFLFRRPLLTTLRAENGKIREEAETLLRMHTRGYDKVRGAQYSDPRCSLRDAFVSNCQRHDLCFQCAAPGHYTTNLSRTVRCLNPRFQVETVAAAYWRG